MALNANHLDCYDILAHHNGLTGQVNSVLCNFYKVDVSVKNAQFRVNLVQSYGTKQIAQLKIIV